MSIKSSVRLKALETQLSDAKAKKSMVLSQIEEKQRVCSKLKKEIRAINLSIEQLKNKNQGKTIISEHCMLRYIERVLGINMQEIEQKILSESDKINIKNLGQNCTYSKDGFKVKIKDGVAVTVLVD